MSLPDTLSPLQVGVLVLEMGGPEDEGKIATAIGICTAESSRSAKASNTSGNSPPSTDRGPWQINSYWHEEVSDQCAYSWRCSTREMLRISGNCSSFSQWATYSPGVGEPYLTTARKAIAAHKKGEASRILGSEVASSGGPGRGGGTPAAGAGALLDDEQRSGLLKALIWTVLVLGGAALAGLGLAKVSGTAS